MAYLLTFEQNERKNNVGVFQSYDHVIKFLESIPFVEKYQDEYGTEYRIPFKQIPDSYTVSYNGWKYVFSCFSYSAYESDGDIVADITQLCDLDSAPKCQEAFVDTETTLDAYCFLNSEINEAIEQREAFFQEAVQYYEKQGRKVTRDGLGSEDGEYILISETGNPDQMRISALLDPQTIDEWQKAGSFEAWIKQHKRS